VGIFLVLLTCPIIFGGIRRVSRVAEIMVPFMAFIYIILAFAITIINIHHLPGIISIIFKKAFDTQAAAGGIAGAAFKTMMTLGIKRGLFSNEAGMGSAPNMAATATTSHPVNQGLIQMLGVFFDTMIICTCTALIILMSGVLDDPSNALLKGVQLTQQAVVSQFGYGAGIFLTIAIFFFAFSSIIGNYAYAEANIEFINQNKSFMFIFRILVLLLIFIGSVAELPVVWDAADLSMGLMATINLIVIVILYPYVLLLLKDYINQIKSGVNQPIFRIKNYPQIEKKVMDKSIW
jgi:AGCS family alanine or glycine:cation symporter